MPNRAEIEGEIVYRWLDRILGDRGWEPTRLARECGLSPSTINRFYYGWREGSPPAHVLSLRTITTVVDNLGVDPPPIAGVSYVKGLRQVAVYSWAAAGRPGIVERGDIGVEPVGKIHAQSKKPDLFGVIVEGNSINHDIPHGFVAVIDPNERIPVDRKYYLIQHEGEPRLRRYRDGPPRFEPNSTEPGHETVFPDRNTVIVGRVIEAVRSL